VSAGQHGGLPGALIDRTVVYPKNMTSPGLPIQKGDLVIVEYRTLVELEGSRHGGGTSACQDDPRSSADPPDAPNGRISEAFPLGP
jgi:hypothetical protein